MTPLRRGLAPAPNLKVPTMSLTRIYLAAFVLAAFFTIQLVVLFK